MKKILILVFFISTFLYAKNSCISCHKGIEDIREKHTGMMEEILKVAEKSGNRGNDCIVCHGGNPKTKIKEKAHSGTIKYFLANEGPKEFYPDPGSPWINQNTCGMCHQEQVMSQYNSLMMSEAGKIQGTLWGFGGKSGYEHKYGNYDAHNPVDLHDRLGSEKYKNYMEKLKELEPQVFVERMQELPQAPTADEVQKDPSLSAYTYLRQECLRCHTGMKGDNRHHKGEYRGVGCSSCHIPYSNSGLYEGKDKSIPKLEKGHMLVHQIQATKDAKVKVNGHEYSGVPVETCNTCHNRGKRIGVSYQGLMETSFSSPYDKDTGANQEKLHGKRYIHLSSDVHLKKGMLCQDCHTSNDVHGDGFLSGATLGSVEIECQDCHGTTKKYPWELPLGYSDEFSEDKIQGEARGVANTLSEYLKKGAPSEIKEGYLLSARGNPLPNVVKDGNMVKVDLASGKTINLKPLKKLKDDGSLSQEATVAMDTVDAHTEKLECYTCHATWAPQCYGCHIKIDYSEGKQHVDWLKASHDHDIHGTTGDMRGNLKDYMIDGKVTETRSFMRWENPPLSKNGEGRVSPTMPGCQTTVTVIGKDGDVLMANNIFKIPNAEGAGDEGQLGIDMSPVQPHTIQKRARDCESCHTNPQVMGFGISGGKLYSDPSKPLSIDIKDADGNILSKHASEHIAAIPNLKNDWSRFVDEEGNQLQTVGHHFKLSRALNLEELSKLDRRGVCMSCHQHMPSEDLAASLMVHVADTMGVNVDNKIHKEILSKNLLLSAWVQVVIGVLGSLIILILVYKIYSSYKNSKDPYRKRWL